MGPVTLVDYKPYEFMFTPVSARDGVTTAPWWLSWDCDGNRRQMMLPMDYQFGFAVDRIPGFWMRGIRALISPGHSWRPSAPHDALYASRGGAIPVVTCTKQFFRLHFSPEVTRHEADHLYLVMALADGQATWECDLAWKALRMFGQEAWDGR